MTDFKKEILVSVVLPSYNAEAYLTKTIDSVLLQTEKDFELIIIDDCSTDGSVKLIECYAKSDSRITYQVLEKNSGGPACPRNKGLELSKGRYIAFIDSDDVWHPEKLRIQLQAMRQNGLDFSSTRLQSFKGFGDIEFKAINNELSFEIIDIKHLLKKNILAASSVMFDRSKVGAMSFSENQKHIAVEDYKMWLDIHQDSSIRSGRLNAPLVFYRVRKGSISRSKTIMALKIYRLLGEIELNGKHLGLKRYYYFLTYLTGALKSAMYT